jgi:HD-GYP domain-containing protein (c-di-GMP phosphodiesterase class II)
MRTQRRDPSLITPTVLATLEALRQALLMSPVLARLHTGAGDTAMRFGRALALPEYELDYLRWGVDLHDLGMLALPHAVLERPGKPSPEDLNQIHQYPVRGHRVLERLHVPQEITEIVLCHQERWDGSGYPKGLVGDAIPRLARVARIVDAYDAMITPRGRDPSLRPERAVRIIWQGSGTQYDPSLVQAFVKFWNRPA